MDTEETLATLWLFVAVGGAVAILFATVRFVGWEIDSLLEGAVTMIAIVVAFVWMTYCTWRISAVDVPPSSRPSLLPKR